MLQQCYNDATIVTKMLQRCYNDIATMLQRCYNDATTMLIRRYNNATTMLQLLQRCYNDATTILRQCYTDATKTLQRRSLEDLGEQDGSEDGGGGGGHQGGPGRLRLSLSVVVAVVAGLGLGLGLRLRFGLSLRLGFRLSLRLRLRAGGGRDGRGNLVIGHLEVGGELEVAEVDAELPAPDGEPLQVGHLESLGEGESDGLAGVLPEDGGRGVPVLKVLLRAENIGGGLVSGAGGSGFADPEEGVGSGSVILEVFNHDSVSILCVQSTGNVMLQSLQFSDELLCRGDREEGDEQGQGSHFIVSC